MSYRQKIVIDKNTEKYWLDLTQGNSCILLTLGIIYVNKKAIRGGEVLGLWINQEISSDLKIANYWTSNLVTEYRLAICVHPSTTSTL